jgi:hypothetical protein
MIEFGETLYWIDLTALDRLISNDASLKAQNLKETETITKENGDTITTTKEYPKSKEIDGAMYDLVRMLLEIVLLREDEMDVSLGTDRALNDLPLNVKIAFNTLIENKILVAEEA